MRLWSILAIILAAQPTKTEKRGGTSESHIASSTGQANKPDDNSGSRQPSVSVTVNNSLPAPNGEDAKQQGADGAYVQRRLVKYTGWLVAVGIATAVFIWWQAFETRRSVRAIRDSIPYQEKTATAALLNAQAVVNAERPWILIEVYWKEGVSGPEPTLSGWVFQAVNKGQTPADIVSLYFEREFVGKPDDLPLPPKYRSPIIVTGDNLMVRDEKWTLSSPIHAESWIDNRGKRDVVMDAKEFPVFYGQVIYRDTLREKTDPAGEHHTRFCFAYNAFMKNIIPSGPQEYRTKS